MLSSSAKLSAYGLDDMPARLPPSNRPSSADQFTIQCLRIFFHRDLSIHKNVIDFMYCNWTLIISCHAN